MSEEAQAGQAKPAVPDAGRVEGSIEDERNPLATSLVLLVLVAALGTWAYFGEGSTTPPPDEADRGVFPRETSYAFHPIQAIGIEIARKGETLRFTRAVTKEEEEGKATQTEEGHNAPIGWQLEDPADRGDDTQLFRLLNRIQHARWRLKLEEPEGFGETTVTCKVARKAGLPAFTLTLGTPIGGEVGLKVEMDERPTRFFRIPEELHTELTRPAWVWRRKVLFDVPLKEVQAVQADVRTDAGPRTLRVERGVRAWRVDASTGDLADRGKAEELVEAMRLLRAATVHADAADAAQQKELGLDPPWATLTVTQRGKDPERLLLGARHPERKQERYALLARRPGVAFTVQTSVFEAALEREKELLYSPRLFMVEAGQEAVTALGAEVTTAPPEEPIRWRVEAKESGWRFLEDGAPLAHKPAVEELTKALLGLRIATRIVDPDLEALGLSPPAYRIELFEGEFRHVLEVGTSQDGGATNAVRRLLPNPQQGQPPLAFVYTAALGELGKSLEGAPLELLDPQIYAASSWDAAKVELEEGGAVRERVSFLPTDPAQPQGMKRWVSEQNPANFDEESFKSWLKLFDRFNVQRYVERRKGADLASYGLDDPRTLTIWVNGFAEGKRVETPKVLLIGRREGEAIYVMTPEGVAIGLVDRRFLHKLYRGFDKGKVLWSTDPFDIGEITFERDGLAVLELVKRGRNWLWGIEEERALVPPRALGTLQDVFLEDLLGRVVLHKTRALAPERIREAGLDHPAWRIVIQTRPMGGKAPERHVLLLGDSAGGESCWAMREGGEVLGVFSGERELREFVEGATPPAPFPAPEK